MVRDWSSSETFIWTPGSPDPGYKVGAWVRQVGAAEYDVGAVPFPIETP
jgi:hypothetical protein